MMREFFSDVGELSFAVVIAIIMIVFVAVALPVLFVPIAIIFGIMVLCAVVPMLWTFVLVRPGISLVVLLLMFVVATDEGRRLIEALIRLIERT